MIYNNQSTDISVIKKDIEKWSKNFILPVSDSEFFIFANQAFDCYETALAAVDTKCRDLLLADFSFFYQMLQIIHNLAVERRTTNDKKYSYFAENMQNETWERLSHVYSNISNRPVPLNIKSRKFLKNIYFNYLKKPYISFPKRSSQTKCTFIGSVSPLSMEYLNRNNIFPQYRFLQEYLAENTPVIENSTLNCAVQNLLHSVARVAQNTFEVELNSHLACKSWILRLSCLLGMYEYFIKKKLFSYDIYANNVANPILKVISLSARRLGKTTYGFTHGNYVSMLHYRVFSYVEPSHFNTFFSPTGFSSQCIFKKYELSKLKKFYPVMFTSTHSKYFQKFLDKVSHHKTYGKIQTVMVMGFPMNNNRCLDEAGAYAPIQLELELRIINDIKRCGFKVIYKGHPERRSEVEGIFEKYADQVIYDKFETVLSKADSYLFTYVETSCFHTAICTSKPVIIIDNIENKWCDPIYVKVCKRCRMVSASFDERNRIIYDDNELHDALLRCPEDPDFSIIEKFYIE